MNFFGGEDSKGAASGGAPAQEAVKSGDAGQAPAAGEPEVP